MRTPTVQRTEIVFIESNIADYQTLLNGINPASEVHVLDASKDGLTQMAQILAGRSGVDAIHIVSHGSEGAVGLGSTTLDSASLQTRATELAQIGQSLTATGDILLYGCNVAAGDIGAQFVGKLAQATGADVAASADLTGAASRGGDWVLEQQTGPIEAQLPGSQLADYAFTLTPLVQTNLFTTDGSIPGGTLSTANILHNFTTTVSSTDPTHFFWYQSPGFEVVLGRLKDGLLGGQTSSVASVFPSDVSITFGLDLVSKPDGFSIKSIKTYASWDSGRDGQEYTVQYATVADPTTFIAIGSAARFNPCGRRAESAVIQPE